MAEKNTGSVSQRESSFTESASHTESWSAWWGKAAMTDRDKAGVIRKKKDRLKKNVTDWAKPQCQEEKKPQWLVKRKRSGS
jgi:hypothetical protein